MTDIKKEQEREELHKAIWNIANDLRGSVDGWDLSIQKSLQMPGMKVKKTIFSLRTTDRQPT